MEFDFLPAQPFIAEIGPNKDAPKVEPIKASVVVIPSVPEPVHLFNALLAKLNPFIPKPIAVPTPGITDTASEATSQPVSKPLVSPPLSPEYSDLSPIKLLATLIAAPLIEALLNKPLPILLSPFPTPEPKAFTEAPNPYLSVSLPIAATPCCTKLEPKLPIVFVAILDKSN